MRKRIHSLPSVVAAARDPVEPKYVGVWIDRSQAHMLTLQGTASALDSVSAEEKGGEPLALDVKRFYRQVVERIGDAEELMIAGPAECRDEFRREFIRHAPLSKRLAEVHLDDAPTPRQMRAKVKRFFEGRQRHSDGTPGTVIAV